MSLSRPDNLPHKPKRSSGLSSLAAVALVSAAQVACGEPTEPGPGNPPQPISVNITGPESLQLSCSLDSVATYELSIPTGSLQEARWSVDGDTTGLSAYTGTSASYRFTGVGTYTVAVEVTGRDGSTANDELVTVASPPDDLEPCVFEAGVLGHFAHLIESGSPSVTSRYRVALPAAIENAVADIRWQLNHPDDTGLEAIASGPTVTEVDIVFSGEGVYQVRVEVLVGGATNQMMKTVTVTEGEPVSEKGLLVFTSQSRGDSTGIYLMDGETGVVDGPVFSSRRMPGDAMACDPNGGNRFIFGLNKLESEFTMGAGGSDLWLFDLDSGEQQRLVHDDGRIWGVAWSVYDILAVLNDTRSGNFVDEVYTGPLGGTMTPLGGPTVNQLFAGVSLAWSPDGGTLAVGGTKNEVNPDSTEIRIVLMNAGGTNRRHLYDTRMTQAYASVIPESGYVIEGNSVVFSRDGEWVVYSILAGHPTEAQYGFYLARAKADGSGGVEVMTEGFSHLAFSGSGKYLYFSKLEPGATPSDFQGINIYQMDFQTGEVVNLSALSVSTPSEFVEFVGCWLSKTEY